MNVERTDLVKVDLELCKSTIRIKIRLQIFARGRYLLGLN